MENRKFCQSCSMPLDNPLLFGTEKNGVKNEEYCRYCYLDGAFVQPDMTLDEMRLLITEKMEIAHVPRSIIDDTVSNLPQLKRWNSYPVQP